MCVAKDTKTYQESAQKVMKYDIKYEQFLNSLREVKILGFHIKIGINNLQSTGENQA